MGTVWTTVVGGEKWNLLKEGKTVEVFIKIPGFSEAILRLTMGDETGMLVEVLELERA